MDADASAPPPLHHFSEEAGIARFEPRAPLERPHIEPMVWAIDEWHAPMYYLPRDCPRACFWPGPATSEQDRERWFGGVDAPMVIAIEAAWLDRLRTTLLHRYRMPPATFRVELRVTPTLIGLWQRVVRSTLHFSGTRLRNARGWDPALF